MEEQPAANDFPDGFPDHLDGPRTTARGRKMASRKRVDAHCEGSIFESPPMDHRIAFLEKAQPEGRTGLGLTCRGGTDPAAGPE